MSDRGLTKKERLRSAKRIDAIFERGSVGKSRLVLARALPNDHGFCRVAVIAGKAAGKATVRNRLRRRLRAAFRLHKHELPRNLDLVLLARRGAREAAWPTLRADLVKAVTRATRDLESRSDGEEQPLDEERGRHR